MIDDGMLLFLHLEISLHLVGSSEFIELFLHLEISLQISQASEMKFVWTPQNT
jgi:hypothetical protein